MLSLHFPGQPLALWKYWHRAKFLFARAGLFYLLFQDLWNFLAGLGHASGLFFFFKVNVRNLGELPS